MSGHRTVHTEVNVCLHIFCQCVSVHACVCLYLGLGPYFVSESITQGPFNRCIYYFGSGKIFVTNLSDLPSRLQGYDKTVIQFI